MILVEEPLDEDPPHAERLIERPYRLLEPSVVRVEMLLHIYSSKWLQWQGSNLQPPD